MIPPRRILAAVDFSDPSGVALAFAARLARHCRAELHVLYAEDPRLAAAAERKGRDLVGEIEEELRLFARSAAGDAPALHVATGAPVETICNIAWRERADLIVIGLRGMSRSGDVFGSVTEGVLRQGALPVCAVPDGWHPPVPLGDDLAGVGPIVTAVDNGEPALMAVAAAARLASALGTSLELVHVVPDLRVPHRWQAHADDAIAECVRLAEPEITAHVSGLGLVPRPRLTIQVGRIAERLAAAAAAAPGRSPMLVMGRRTARHTDGAPASIAARVLAIASVPVLMHVQGD
jgi:nucleotide-binding universal stress UspA family protein